MRGDFWRTWLPWILLATAAIGLGLGIAIASSPGSLGRSLPRAAGGSPTGLLTSPAASSQSTPSPQLKAGQLSPPVKLQLLGDRLFMVAAGRAIISPDGSSWTPLPTGIGGGAVAPDPGNPRRFVSGGTTVRVSIDGGSTWRVTRAAPPIGGPYQPLAISPTEPGVWFILHQGQLARTRDAGISWRNLSGLPTLGASPLLVTGAATGQFFIAVQAQVFELDDNGQQIQARGQLPGGQAVSELVQATAGTPGVLLARTSAGSVFVFRDGTWSEAHPIVTGPLSGAPGKLAILVDGGGQLGVAGEVSVSTDGGQTWIAATGLPEDQSVLAAGATADGQRAYAYCAAGDVYRSQDGGRTWSLLAMTLRTP